MPIDSEYAYKAKAGTCVKTNSTFYGAKKGTFASLNNEAKFKNWIMNNGPIQAGFAIYKTFYQYKSGVYQDMGGNKIEGYHAIEVLGWGKENGKEFWICKNSWGKWWGDNGYFKIEKNNCKFPTWGGASLVNIND
jgi:C1A family cysteine protease